MKNQYFGDLKDLFKYDLMAFISTQSKLKHIFFVPMLTKNDSSRHGFDTNYIEAIDKERPGTKNKELMKYLIERMIDDRRDIREIKSFFKKANLELYIHYEKKEHFSKEIRERYFRKMNFPADCLLFFDPDIGLEVTKSDERHLKYSELREIYGSMSGGSIAMVFQYIFPMANKAKCISDRISKLAKFCDNCCYITDSKLAFLFLTKKPAILTKLKKILHLYRKNYPHNKKIVCG